MGRNRNQKKRPNKGLHYFYLAWVDMKGACYSPNHSDYEHNGAMGIKVCFQWLHGQEGYTQFCKDVGHRKTKNHRLRRLDPAKDWEPGNVEWREVPLALRPKKPQQQKPNKKRYKNFTKNVPEEHLNSVEFKAWTSIVARCYSKHHWAYNSYGRFGVSVCPQWLGDNGFVTFLKDMGPCPEHVKSCGPTKIVARWDKNKNYTPENCYWCPDW